MIMLIILNGLETHSGMRLPFLAAGFSQHHYFRIQYLICWPRFHKYHTGPTYLLYSKESTTLGACMVIRSTSLIGSHRSYWPDRARGWPFESTTEMPAGRWHTERTGHPLQHVIYILNQCRVYVTESPQTEYKGSRYNDWKRSKTTYYHAQWPTCENMWFLFLSSVGLEILGPIPLASIH